VVFIDEIDSLQNETLISVLRQLRTGYNWRPTGFPASLALIGMRDVRDYKVAAGGSERLNTASPFNVKTDSITLGSFTREDVATLYHSTPTRLDRSSRGSGRPCLLPDARTTLAGQCPGAAGGRNCGARPQPRRSHSCTSTRPRKS
jgi:hypothetical protein